MIFRESLIGKFREKQDFMEFRDFERNENRRGKILPFELSFGNHMLDLIIE